MGQIAPTPNRRSVQSQPRYHITFEMIVKWISRPSPRCLVRQIVGATRASAPETGGAPATRAGAPLRTLTYERRRSLILTQPTPGWHINNAGGSTPDQAPSAWRRRTRRRSGCQLHGAPPVDPDGRTRRSGGGARRSGATGLSPLGTDPLSVRRDGGPQALLGKNVSVGCEA